MFLSYTRHKLIEHFNYWRDGQRHYFYILAVSALAIIIVFNGAVGLISYSGIVNAATRLCHSQDYVTGNLNDSHSRTLDQAQIQRAINDCSQKGGGEVVLEKGKTYHTGTIVLKNNTTLYLNGATLLAENDKKYFWLPKFPSAVHPHRFVFVGTESGTHNVEIKGPGLLKKIDNFFDLDMIEFWNSSHIYVGGTSAQSKDLVIDTTRSDRCQSSKLCGTGFHLVSSASDNVLFENVSVYGRKKAQGGAYGNDGIDIQSSQNVVVKNCLIDTADDGVAIASSDGSGEINNNNLIENCTIASDTAGIKFGTGSSYDIKNITFRNIILNGRKGINIMNLDGATFSNLYFENITILPSVEQFSRAGSGWNYSRICDRQGDQKKIRGCRWVKDATWVRQPACMDGRDNDGDGLIDGEDPDCHPKDHDANNCNSYDIGNDSESKTLPVKDSPRRGTIKDVYFKNITTYVGSKWAGCGESSLNNIQRLTLQNFTFKGGACNDKLRLRDICGLSLDSSFNKNCLSLSNVKNIRYDGGQPICNTSPPPSSPVCGNGVCEQRETCSTCPADCGACPNPPHNPDINQDGQTDIQDLGILLSNWGKTDKRRYDLNGNGAVDNGDLSILLKQLSG